MQMKDDESTRGTDCRNANGIAPWSDETRMTSFHGRAKCPARHMTCNQNGSQQQAERQFAERRRLEERLRKPAEEKQAHDTDVDSRRGNRCRDEVGADHLNSSVLHGEPALRGAHRPAAATSLM